MSGPQSRRRADGLSLDRIRQLAELMQEHSLTDLELSERGQRIRLSRGTGAPSVAPVVPADLPGSTTASGPETSETKKESAEAKTDPENVVVVKSPMVGTFYNKANPDAEPYVRVGDHVGPDTIICIIEAMKVFNEIPAEVSGQIVEVLLENEEPVDFGKPLFKIDTGG